MSNYDPTDLRSQERTKQETDARARVARDIEIADVKWLMSSPRGRRLLWRILGLAGVFQLTFDTVAMKMAFAEGKRAIGNFLADEVLTICPERYLEMQRESWQSQKEQHDAKRDSRDDNNPTN